MFMEISYNLVTSDCTKDYVYSVDSESPSSPTGFPCVGSNVAWSGSYVQRNSPVSKDLK